MATKYLIFASQTAAINASKADWVVRVLGHPVVSTAATAMLWDNISNSAGTVGVITDNISLSALSSNEQASLVDATDPTVAAVLAQVVLPPRT
jgi:hypothetical protein